MTKIINGFSNYSINTDGIVTNIKTNSTKKPWLGKVGYYYLDLYSNNKNTKIALHRLLAMNFLPNPDNKRTVNHIDGNKQNNNLSNLEWATDSENKQHAWDTGLNTSMKLISDTEYKNILTKFFTGISLTDIVKEYNFSLPTFSTYIDEYVTRNNLQEEFSKEKVRQKLIRAKKAGNSKRAVITLQMVSIDSGTVLETFYSITEAKEFLNKKSSGPISNVIAGRQKSAYGYYWKKL